MRSTARLASMTVAAPAGLHVPGLKTGDIFTWSPEETFRQVFHDQPEDKMRRILAENAAKLYDFDLDALAPLAEKYGPTVEELRRPLTELPENPNMALLRGAAA